MIFNRQAALLNAVMLAALVAVLSGAAVRFISGWQPIYLAGACLLVALEAGLVHYAARSERMALPELARYLVPELTVMVVLMRVAATLSVRTATLAADARNWLYDPLSIFDHSLLAFILIGLLIGLLAHVNMRDLGELAPQPFEAPDDPTDGNKQYRMIVAQDRAAALARINNRLVIGGALLLLALGLEAVNLEEIGGSSRPVSGLSASGALAYLVSGFLLYSQARLALLQSRWRLEGARVAEGVTRRWTRMSWLIIAAIAGLAALLPRGYGLGLLDTIRGAFGLLGYLLAFIGYLVIWLFGLLALIPALLLAWLSGPASTSPPPPPPAPFVPPPPPPEVTHEPRLLAALIFWGCMCVLAGYAAVLVVQRHPGLRHALTSRGPLAWLLRQFGSLWRDTRSWAGQAAHSVQTLLRRPQPKAVVRIPALRLSRLAPRELVRYFYRSILRRAAQRGLPRRGAQTPYEYGASLQERLPDARQDIAELTDAFVVAEYSARPIDPEDVRRTRRPWQRVRRRLRSLTEAGEPPASTERDRS